MAEPIRRAALELGDLTLGWLLQFPSDVGLLVLALGSALLFVAARIATTDQDLLRRCAADRRQLRRKRREARRRRDREELDRLKATRHRVAMMQLRAELKPLFILLLPVAFLANWAWHRLDVHPPLETGSAVRLEAWFPASAVGEMAHLVPMEGMSAGESWVREIQAGRWEGARAGRAEWAMRYFPGPTANRDALVFVVRHRQRTCEWRWRFDRRRHDALEREFADTPVRLRLGLPRVRLLGFVPGLPFLGLPPWLVGYLWLTLGFVALLKKLMRVS